MRTGRKEKREKGVFVCHRERVKEKGECELEGGNREGR